MASKSKRLPRTKRPQRQPVQGERIKQSLNSLHVLTQQRQARLELRVDGVLKDLATSVSKLADEVAGITEAVEMLTAQVRIGTERTLPKPVTVLPWPYDPRKSLTGQLDTAARVT